MRQDGSVALFHYWDRLRDGRPAPKRTEIEPADIKGLLADTFILEQDSRGEAIFRLAGTRLCATFGRELKGFSFPTLWKQKDQRLVGRLTHGVFTQKSVLVAAFEGQSQGGRTCAFELLLLPLEGGTDSRRSLGIVTPVARPFWLGADPIVEARLDSVRVVDPDREPMFIKNRPAIEVPDLSPEALGESRDASGGRPGRRIRHLVVLEGGRTD